ncbi:MAG: Type secretory pathway component PulD-like protein [Gemmatimonadetes bacterium]|nr:Type secretory pathway component PulD-like protein [Gemmatimonadota bacterium]
MNSRLSIHPVALAAALSLAACSRAGSGRPVGTEASPAPQDDLLRHGVSALQLGKVDDARRDFRQVLKYDPRNARAHLALAATFEADALDGDIPKRELAQVGYQQALLFDERSWLAAYRLGVLEIAAGRYAASIEHLSRAAVLNRREPAILGELARALYLSAMFAEAQAVVERALVASPHDAGLLHNAAMIAAAAGDSAQATQWSEQFASVAGDAGAVAELRQRLGDWRAEQSRMSRVSAATPGAVAARLPGAVIDSMSGFPAATRSPFLTSGETEAKSTMMQPLPQLPAGARARMVQVDLMLIRTQEIQSENRGVNLLTGLKANFAASNDRAITRAEGNDGVTSQSVSSTILRSLKIPEVLYSLDIANTGYDRSDVLARPLLVALDGQPANYFVGEQLSIPVSSAGGFAPGTLIDKSIGTEIAITPTFIDDNTVLLSVSASRSFVATNFVPGSNTPVRQTIQRVTTAVVADFDQTVILSGLSEHESRSIKAGVPVLQEIPLLQYLFSGKSEQLFETSVLMVLTPRRVGQTQSTSKPGEGSIETTGLTQLKEYFPELDARITILRQLTRTLPTNTFRKLLSREDVVAAQRQSRDEFARRIGNQLRGLLYF